MTPRERFQLQLDKCCKPQPPQKPLTGIEKEATQRITKIRRIA